MASEAPSRPFTFWLGLLFAIPGVAAAAAVVVLTVLQVVFGKMSAVEEHGFRPLLNGVLLLLFLWVFLGPVAILALLASTVAAARRTPVRILWISLGLSTAAWLAAVAVWRMD